MAKYRFIQTDFWEDGFVLDLTPEEKYFYLYLLSNSRTTQCGCYELPYKVIEMQTGYNRETVEKLMQRFVDYGKIEYLVETKEILIKNWHKFNFSKSPKVMNCILKEIKNIKNKSFKEYLNTVCIGYGYGIDTVSIDYGEKEKEKEKELTLTNNINNNKHTNKKNKQCVGTLVSKNRSDNLSIMSKLYQENIGVANGLVAEWLIEIESLIDIDLYKRGLEICTDRGKLSLGYLKGIIKNWMDNNITSFEQLKAYELQQKSIKAHNEFITNGTYTEEVVEDLTDDPEFMKQVEELNKKLYEFNEEIANGKYS